MNRRTRLAELAALIADHSTKIDEYLKVNGLAAPSFDLDFSSDHRLTEEIYESRTVVLEATKELHSLLQGSSDFYGSLMVDAHVPKLQDLT